MPDASPAKFKKLVSLLKELFQLDQPDLDFGIYRIMHAKAGEVTQFLERDLLPQVQAAFASYQSADSSVLRAELARAIEQAQALGADPGSLPKVRELRQRIDHESVDIGALENETYDHLYSFFRRYYSEGDFLAKRVYKPGVYAIPYEGEEVTLHWANKDQYYIKTSEYLRDYAFRLRPDAGEGQDPMRVRFKLVDAAEGEHGNVKAAEGKDRVFLLTAQDFIAQVEGELELRFEYRPAMLDDWPAAEREGKTKPPTQKDLTAFAVQQVLSCSSDAGEGQNENALASWLEELTKTHVKADGERAEYTRLEAHLRRYTARNTFDYFIHKDLGGFLRRELDFYIKNEVMHLDDVESETAPRVEQYLSKIKVIRRIAGKIIDFLAQLENFQKKLWLKKKFVVGSDWLVAMSQVPDELLPDVCANATQLAEWKQLHSLHELPADITRPGFSEPLAPEYLRSFPNLMLDTRHFDLTFTQMLLDGWEDLDVMADGLVIHGDNFQALNVLWPKFDGYFKSVYIDPPYNTDAGPIDYKNGYRNSSWMSLMGSRLRPTELLLSDDGVLCITIDDYQVHELATLLGDHFGKGYSLGSALIRNNPSGRPSVRGLSITHEYALFYGMGASVLERLPRTQEQLERFSEEEGELVNWQPFRKGGGAVTYRTERPKQYYPIYVDILSHTLRIPTLEWNETTRSWIPLEEATSNELTVFPIDERNQHRIWSLGHETARNSLDDLEVRSQSDGLHIFRRHRPADGVVARSWWDKTTYGAREYGSAALMNLFGETVFSFAKSPFAVEDCLRVSGLRSGSKAAVLDYFAGSGTTGHAVINLNREDGGARKFVLVEQGDYVGTVLLPRLQKVTFAPEWKDGKPRRLATNEEAERGPRLIKVLRLESYEDTLNNLALQRNAQQQAALDFGAAQGDAGLREQYLLRYQLDVESRGSASLLDIGRFSDPTAYKLVVKTPGSDESREVNVDLLETFNWLLGLTVRHIAAPRSFAAEFERDDQGRLQLQGRLRQQADGPWWFRTVTGTTPEGRQTLVIWRKLTGDAEQDNLVLEEWFKNKQAYSVRDAEFDLIYVNGDNTLENLRLPDEGWKVRPIEEDFQRLMFEGTD
jgi:adenine-specific DNA-methyltransferase